MIRSLLIHAERYFCLGPAVVRAFDFIRNTDFSKLSAGRYDVVGDKVYALVQERMSLPLHEAPFENHCHHIDLQMTLQGEEWVGYCPVEKLTPLGAYNKDTDVQLYQGTGSLIRSEPDGFNLFFPEDGHQPYVTLATPAPLKKLVMRIRLDSINL